MMLRRNKKDSIEQGGWSLYILNVRGAGHSSPLVAQGPRTGAAAASGWPANPRMEVLRDRWIDTADETEQRAITRELRETAISDVISPRLGITSANPPGGPSFPAFRDRRNH